MRKSLLVSLFTAILLAGLAVLGVQGWLADERARLSSDNVSVFPQKEPTKIVVAAEQISFGERVGVTKVRQMEWGADAVPLGSFSSVEDLILGDGDDSARFALTNISPGEPILASRVTIPGQRAKLSTALTAGMKAISIRVNDVLGVAGFVLPGDRVDVLLMRGSRGSDTYVDVLLQGVKVLAIDQIVDEMKDKPSVVRTVTFEVNTTEAQKLVLAGNVGTLSLALRNVGSNGVEMNDRITLADLSDLDIAEDLVPVEVKAEEPKPNPEYQELQVLLKSTLDGISDRLSSVEDKIQKPEPAKVEKIVERPVIALPVVPKKATVAVIRNGRRDEYKVEPSSAGTYGIDTRTEPQLVTLQLNEDLGGLQDGGQSSN